MWFKPKNGGVIPKRKISVTDYHYGGISGITSEELNPVGDWTRYLPEKEYQYGTFVDTMACVTFSALNCIEALFKKQYSLSYNFSDRFVAKLSDTTNRGNYLYKVADTIRKYGLIEEDKWPFDRSTFHWDSYYTDIPSSLFSDGENFNNHTEIRYEFVSPDFATLKNALYEAPVQVTLTYPNVIKNGVYERIEGLEQHAVMLFNYRGGIFPQIYDTYDDTIKTLSPNYKFFTALKYNLTTKKQPMAIPSNTLLQLVEGEGGFGLLVGDKLYVDDLAKIIASWLVRNNGKVEGKVRAVKYNNWSELKQFNLKNQPLN